MALASPYVPTGRFAPNRVWSCSKHDGPEEHWCDCEHCHLHWLCEECEHADWVDETDENGQVVMHEMSTWECLLADGKIGVLEFLAGPLIDWSHTGGKIEWLEDEAMPRLTSE